MPLTSLWLRFPVDRPVEFQSYSGFASRGIFFEFLRSYDEDLAYLLHSGGGVAPYSTTPILANEGVGSASFTRGCRPAWPSSAFACSSMSSLGPS